MPAATVAQKSENRMRVKPGAGFGKGVPSRAINVDPAVEEEDSKKSQLGLIVNALHELMRLQKLSTKEPREDEDAKTYTRCMGE